MQPVFEGYATCPLSIERESGTLTLGYLFERPALPWPIATSRNELKYEYPMNTVAVTVAFPHHCPDLLTGPLTTGFGRGRLT